jgi:hypothetical protein
MGASKSIDELIREIRGGSAPNVAIAPTGEVVPAATSVPAPELDNTSDPAGYPTRVKDVTWAAGGVVFAVARLAALCVALAPISAQVPSAPGASPATFDEWSRRFERLAAESTARQEALAVEVGLIDPRLQRQEYQFLMVASGPFYALRARLQEQWQSALRSLSLSPAAEQVNEQLAWVEALLAVVAAQARASELRLARALRAPQGRRDALHRDAEEASSMTAHYRRMAGICARMHETRQMLLEGDRLMLEAAARGEDAPISPAQQFNLLDRARMLAKEGR